MVAHGADAFNLDHLSEEAFTRNVSSLAALVLVICEYFATFDDEVRFIWRRPLNRVRLIYLFSRYLALCALIINFVLLTAGPLSRLPNHVGHCRGWFTFLTIVSCFILFAIDAVAMLRLYALYNCNPKVGAFFSSLVVIEATLVTTCSSRTIGIVPFSPICDVKKTPFQVIYFAGGVIATQCALIILTIRKRKVTVGERHLPLLKLVLREGAWMSSLVCCIFMFTVPYSLITGTAKPHLVLVWPTSLISNAACRVILNMHNLPSSRPPLRTQTTRMTDTNIQFTSFFDASGFMDQSGCETGFSRVSSGNSGYTISPVSGSESSTSSGIVFGHRPQASISLVDPPC